MTLQELTGAVYHTTLLGAGWNRKALLDRPRKIVVEEEDRNDKEHARMVFNKLYSKETFDSSWGIVQTFVIAKLSNKLQS